jgi:putative ABC transport system substrate-binding protein
MTSLALKGRQMKRREFIALLGGAAIGAWRSTAQAQQAVRLRRVGALFLGETDAPGSRSLIEALAKLGYVEGRSIAYELRSIGREDEQIAELARNLVATKPDVIVSAGSAAVQALMAATREIPIVVVAIGDPVALGMTKSMARPTGNVTGFTTAHDTLAAKRIELLQELIPSLRKVALMWVPSNPLHRLIEDDTRKAAMAFRIELLSLPVRNADDIAPAIARLEEQRVQALIVGPDPLTVRNRQTIIDQCAVRDLPAIHNYSFEVREGALMSYGSDVGDDYGRAALYVDRILKGAKVSDLPFQEPTQFTLAINLRTARSLGLKVPQSLLVRADEVIE